MNLNCRSIDSCSQMVTSGRKFIKGDIYPLSATGFTASAFDVEGKLSGFIAARFGFDGLGEDFADGVEYACISDGIRSRGATEGGSIDDIGA